MGLRAQPALCAFDFASKYACSKYCSDGPIRMPLWWCGCRCVPGIGV
jgi:hypothetical protein